MLLLLAIACRGPIPDPDPDPTPTPAEPPAVAIETVGGWTGTAPMLGETGDTGTAPPPFTMTDVTVAAGVDYVQWVQDPLAQRECNWSLLLGGGAAAADYDGDGDVDLFASRFESPSLLFRNRGDGTFDEVGAASGLVTTGWANGALWFDADSDADLDLLVTRLREGEGNLLFMNDGAGGFTEEGAARGVALPPPPDECARLFSASAGDFDRDGDLDLHLAQWNNLDPDQDVSRTLLLRNEGGTFVDVTATAGVYSERIAAFTSGFTDFDADGWVDLWIVADFGQSKLYLNNTDGTFRNATAEWGLVYDTNGMGGATGDWDGDGATDLFVTAILPGNLADCGRPDWGCSGNVLYANAGYHFVNDLGTNLVDGGWGWGAVFSDVDRDGDLDLFHAAGEIEGVGWPYGPELPRLFLNEAGTASDVAAAVGLAVKGLGRAALAFDADGDGDPDLFQTSNADHPTLWRNDAPLADSLRVRPRGPVNRYGIGARVELERVAGGPVLVREVHANSGYLGNSPAEADFGLGTGGGTIHEVRVTWPGGATVVLADVAPNGVLIVEEP
ncbi:MAG: CRTAC1 family protein [Deltaproteobacteria bacterium]|nr:CRTAC1 family protein [Deltaproteobacteria bacterium]